MAISVPGGDWSKRETLRRLINENEVKNAIVFCNRKRDVDVVAKSLIKHGFSAAALHGDLDQSVRTRTLDAFRNGELRLLIASDVAARGLDIPAVSHIFNFDVPFQPDDYVHRIGRTGRAGRTGHAFMLVGSRDEKCVAAIERLMGSPIPRRAMEGLPEEAPKPERARDPRGGRGRERPRGRERERVPHGHRASYEPASVTAPAPAATEIPPAQAEVPAREALPRNHPNKSDQRPKQIEPRSSGHDPSQLPAFLLRPVRLPPKAVRKLAGAENET
jgi:superfamily II DNA/RNA helicase